MMRPLLILPLLPLLAACATPAPAPPPAEPPEHAACRAEARGNDAVQALLRQDNPGNWANRERVQNDLKVAELRAFRDCLRRNGLAAPGGVEPVR